MEPTNSIQIWLPEGKAAVNKLERDLTLAIVEAENNDAKLKNRITLHGIKAAIEKVLKNEQVKFDVLQALSYYPEKTVSIYGAEVSKVDGKKEYDFSVCNDPVLAELQLKHKTLISRIAKILQTVEVEIQKRETFLKGINKPLTIADEETGEVYTINPPSMTQGETISIKFV